VPKETFYNLPEDKRELICDVALAEFAEYSFDQASVNRIVAGSGIAKGSFYQYFEDKKDLFLYLVQLAAEEKAKYISPLLRNPANHDIFTLLREMYASGIRFAAEHPAYAEIGKRLMGRKDAPVYGEVMAGSLPSAYKFFETLLENAMARGEVRAGIDSRLFAFMMASLNALVVEYYFEFVSSDYGEEMFATIDKLLDFLKHGIGVGS
jgi:AcrR family transcriptional regulator